MKIELFLRNLKNSFQEGVHRFRLWRLGLGKGKSYEDYLNIQFSRTRKKNTASLLKRTKLLVDELLEVEGISPFRSKVLCIGCRNATEIEYFKSKGCVGTIGIDLYSIDHQVTVMDMHNLLFHDNQFDIVYASHSLEHSYAIDRVVAEIIRVAKENAVIAVEVPIHYQVRGADLIDFGGAEGVCKAFSPNVETVFLLEEQEPHTDRNDSGTAIARVVFKIKKYRERG